MIKIGKTADIYDAEDDCLTIVRTDRQSAFDRHICDVPYKGVFNNMLSAWWFEKLKHVIPNHMVHTNGRMMTVKKCKVLPVEVIVRGYITGSTKTSLWTHYSKGSRTYCGITFPDGLVKNQRLDEPVITPTTKGVVDKPISETEVLEIVTAEQWNVIKKAAIQLYTEGAEIARGVGLILVDTKYEFGLDCNGNVMLIDELHSTDSSRYWFADNYEKLFAGGQEPNRLDKDLIRNYVQKTYGTDYKGKITVPYETIRMVIIAYMSAYNTITDSHLDIEDAKFINIDYKLRIFTNLDIPIVVLIAGSASDQAHVDAISDALKTYCIKCVSHVASAHRNTRRVLDIIKKYDFVDKRIIYVAVAGKSNALGGVMAANSIRPVINCPPFADKIDMMVNLQSSMQCPDDVPALTVLSAKNCALAIRKIFFAMPKN